MSPTGFEPAIPGSEKPQTHVLDCEATEPAYQYLRCLKYEVLKTEFLTVATRIPECDVVHSGTQASNSSTTEKR